MPLIQLTKASTVVPSWSVPGQIEMLPLCPGRQQVCMSLSGLRQGLGVELPSLCLSYPALQPTFSGLEMPEPLKYTKLGGP